jgi:protein-arginine kinase activator protein McsA
MDDFIYKKNSKHKYYKATCIECGIDRGWQRKHLANGLCRSCSSKRRCELLGNPMQGRKHDDTSKFRKHSYSHYDYEDKIVEYSKSGNKRIKYRKSCPSCGIDMGYHLNVDGERVCKKCRDDSLRKYTPEQKRLRSSMKANIGARLRSRNSGKNYTSTFSMLPYSFEELVERLELQFKDGMTWENYGEWEIDHIRPDSWFDYESYNDDGFLESWALENLQPMWKSENASKSNRYEG